jgi:hypothetical protein
MISMISMISMIGMIGHFSAQFVAGRVARACVGPDIAESVS